MCYIIYTTKSVDCFAKTEERSVKGKETENFYDGSGLLYDMVQNLEKIDGKETES